MWVCERVRVYVFVTLWVACFNLVYLESKLEYVLTIPFIAQSDSAWHLSWIPINVAGKVSFLKENHVFLFTSIISQVKCHMGKKNVPVHNLKKKIKNHNFHLSENDAFIYGHFMWFNCPQEKPIRSESN